MHVCREERLKKKEEEKKRNHQDPGPREKKKLPRRLQKAKRTDAVSKSLL